MTPRQKAARRAEEIEAAISGDTLPTGKRKTLEDELTAIGDNMAEGCYSGDPDDGIDWSDCPGISRSRPYEPEPEYMTFICPEMRYKLYYRNDEGRTTYDDAIPADILPVYRDRIEEALEQAYFIQVKHPDITGVTPGVEVIDGNLHGTLTVSSSRVLSPESAEELRNKLTDLVAGWSIHFENQQIKTDGGNLYVRFYDSNDPILPETTFINQAYVNRHSDVFDTVKYYANKNPCCLRIIFYDPDSSAGGQLVQNNLYPDMLRGAFAECQTLAQFLDCLPATDEEMTDALEFIGVSFPFKVSVDKFESRIAAFAGIADESADLGTLNDLADQIDRMDDTEYIKYKAVLEYEGALPIQDGADCGVLIQRLCGYSYQLEQYSFFPQYHDAESFGKGMLDTCNIPAWIKPHVNLREFGQSQLSESNMTLGSYGVIRPEYEQKQAFAAEPEPEQQMGGM